MKIPTNAEQTLNSRYLTMLKDCFVKNTEYTKGEVLKVLSVVDDGCNDECNIESIKGKHTLVVAVISDNARVRKSYKNEIKLWSKYEKS